MRRLVSEGYNCSLTIVGGYEEDYKNVIAEYQSEGWLKYMGYQQNVKSFYKECHCFVLPSYYEGMANVLLEAATTGRPIITSDIPGCREAIIADESGLLCKRKDIDSLYNVMKHMCQYDESKLETIGVGARNHILQIFDKKRLLMRL